MANLAGKFGVVVDDMGIFAGEGRMTAVAGPEAAVGLGPDRGGSAVTINIAAGCRGPVPGGIKIAIGIGERTEGYLLAGFQMPGGIDRIGDQVTSGTGNFSGQIVGRIDMTDVGSDSHAVAC